MVHNNDSLVYPTPDSTELLIQRTIEGIQKMISIHENQGEGVKEKVAITTKAAAKTEN